MKLVLSGVILALSMCALSTCSSVTGPDTTLFPEALIDTTLHIKVMQEGDLTIFTVDKFRTTIVKIPRIAAYLYSQHPSRSLREIAMDSGYACVVNASFFDALYTDSAARAGLYYRHAGYLKIRDSVYEPVKADRQLSRFFAYNSEKNIAGYYDVTDLEKTKGYDLVVQTGPQIISANELDTASINSSINGNRNAPRTTFASVDGKEFYIITSFNIATLGELARMLRSTGIFKKELQIINFDGGPSTRIYIRNHPELCSASEAPWPVVICVK